MRNAVRWVLGLAAGVCVFEGNALGQLHPIEPLGSQLVASVPNALWCGSPPGDRSRLFVLGGQRQGPSGETPLRVVSISRPLDGPAVYTLLPTPFLMVPAVAARSVAFAPDYAASGYLYVAHEETWQGGGGSQITRYRRSASNPDVADPASAFVIMRVPGATFDHAVGSIHFGPDGHLYVGVGDAPGNPQSAASLGGKVLRIDVTPGADDFPDDPARNYRIPAGNPFPISTVTTPPPPRPEVLHVGLRNPWRWAFDRLTGDMWIGDVGAGSVEEINLIPTGLVGQPLRNFCWPRYEGMRRRSSSVALMPGSQPHKPVLSYLHGGRAGDGEIHGFAGGSIAGGVVYRGAAIPTLQGRYLFADTYNSWLLAYDTASLTLPPVNIAPMVRRVSGTTGSTTLSQIVSFGEDADGEVYFCEYGSGRVRKIVPFVAPTPPAP